MFDGLEESTAVVVATESLQGVKDEFKYVASEDEEEKDEGENGCRRLEKGLLSCAKALCTEIEDN